MGIEPPKHASFPQPRLTVMTTPQEHRLNNTASDPVSRPPRKIISNTTTIQTRLLNPRKIQHTMRPYTDTHGDFPISPKPQDTFRILYSNINGISPKNLEQESQQMAFQANTYHIDLLGLVETNINWFNKTTYDQVRRQLIEYWPQSLLQTSSYITSQNTIYQPGGTLTLIGNNWTGGATGSSDTSGMGRWSTIKITGRQGRILELITVYRVTKNTIQNAGSTTSYYQQWHHLRRLGNAKPDPRQQILSDLSIYIQTIQAPNTAIIIMMDANEATTDIQSKIGQWVQSNDLVDVHMFLHELSTDIPTHIRGSKRIDYIFGTMNILPYVLQGGILPYHFITNTDHRSLYIDIDLQKFLRCQPPSNATQDYRAITQEQSRSTVNV